MVFKINIKNIAKNIPTLKTVVYAPHEFRHQKVKTESLPSSITPRAFDEVCAIGAKSKITENPNEPITPDSIGKSPIIAEIRAF